MAAAVGGGGWRRLGAGGIRGVPSPGDLRHNAAMKALDYIRVVLLEPTHPGNIGAAARAMANMGLRHLALVNPREFPSAQATARAAGADAILENAAVAAQLDHAIADCQLVVGASARLRSIEWPLLPPAAAMRKVAAAAASGAPAALLFGRESRGLTNRELDRCHYLVRIPANPDFSSLNLAAAVMVLCYELRQAALGLAGEGGRGGGTGAGAGAGAGDGAGAVIEAAVDMPGENTAAAAVAGGDGDGGVAGSGDAGIAGGGGVIAAGDVGAGVAGNVGAAGDAAAGVAGGGEVGVGGDGDGGVAGGGGVGVGVDGDGGVAGGVGAIAVGDGDAGFAADIDTVALAEPPAVAAEMQHFYRHLRAVVDILEFGNGRTEKLHRKLTRLFNRARPTSREIRTLRGLLSAIERQASRKPR